jgi:integrase-like protein
LERAAVDADLQAPRPKKGEKSKPDDRIRLTWHVLRDHFASVLIANGANVVFVSRQLGHSSPDVTLRVYSHLFDRAEQGDRTRELLESQFGNLVETRAGTGPHSEPGERVAEVLDMQAKRT